MSLFLTASQEKEHGAPLGAEWLVVCGVPFRNTAAKFWSRLIDEFVVAFPDCDRIVLSAPDERPLSPSLLDPTEQLEREIERLGDKDPGAALQGLIRQMELLGPPQPVRTRLLSGETEAACLDLPTECVDSSAFPFLAAWLLAWAGTPGFLWANEFVEGEFTADDVRREVTYEVCFALHNRPASEGLIERELTLHCVRS